MIFRLQLAVSIQVVRRGSARGVNRFSQMPSVDRLKGKVALVTGGGSGIGAACAVLFARQGAVVAVADVNLPTAELVSAEINARRGVGRAIGIRLDVTDRVQCFATVEQVVNEFGTLDVLVNSAGVTARGAPDDWDFEQTWDWVIDVNLKGSMMMSRAAVEHMRQRGKGSIVNMASIIGLVGYAEGLSDGFNPYPHSKGGVVQMTRDMGVALAKSGIRVNALCPGFTYSNLTKALTNHPEMLAKLESLHPIGRLAKPIEVAYAALFLASDESSFVTGSCLAVDGGYTSQ